MSNQLPDGIALPTTRAELVTLQRDSIERLEKPYFRGKLLVPGVSGRLKDRLRIWHDIDRTPEALALPPGELDADHATIRDARDRPDLDEVIRAVSFRKQVRITGLGLIGPSLLAVIPGTIGLVMVIGAFFGDTSKPAAAALLLIGLLLFIPALTMWAKATAESFRRQQEFNLVGVEAALYRARRETLTGVVSKPEPKLPAWARPVAGLFVVALVLILLLRVASAEPIAIGITILIIVLAAALCVRPLLRRRAMHVIPLRAAGPSVIDKPARRVGLEFAGGVLEIRVTSGEAAPATIAADDVIAVVPVSLGYPFAPDAVGLVTRDVPVVLAGSKVGDEPAIAQLKDLIARR